MTPEQIENVVAVAASHGVNKIKFTGGESAIMYKNDFGT